MSNRNELLIITCPARRVDELLEQLSQQLTLEYPTKHAIALYGVTEKAHEGFVLMLSEPRFPPAFLESLQAENLVDDFIRCGANGKPVNQES